MYNWLLLLLCWTNKVSKQWMNLSNYKMRCGGMSWLHGLLSRFGSGSDHRENFESGSGSDLELTSKKGPVRRNNIHPFSSLSRYIRVFIKNYSPQRRKEMYDFRKILNLTKFGSDFISKKPDWISYFFLSDKDPTKHSGSWY